MKQTIAIDIDDVLAANAKGFVEFSNKRWGTNLTVEDYDEHWGKLWKIEHDELVKRQIVVHNSKIAKNYEHFPQAKPVLKELAKKYKLVVVTARRKMLSKDTNDWIEKYFEGLFKEIHYAGIWDDLEKPVEYKINLTKAEVCRQISADYLIDDQPKHCIAAAEAGITALLFGDYSWNRHHKTAPGIIRAKDWSEVLDYFDEESRQKV